MKKGLLSILAGALVLVGCQNYDDQFDSLESQINALASTVAGLSQVQSDLASLAGTVSSLASTVNGLGDTIDTAVADGLSDIQADIDAIEAAVADVASSEEVSALSDAVAASQEDLDELLANSSVFTGDVTVNSVATLDAFHAMGSSLAIVNGNVDIDVDTEMDMVKVQELVNQFLTITKDLDYTAEASTIAEVTFDNLTGVQTVTLEQPGGYVLGALKSAQKIYLSDKYKGSVDVIDFRSLTSVASIGTDSYTNNKIDFNKATEIHLTALPYYTPGSLELIGKKGGVIDITALRDVNATGEQADLDLTLNGPASVSISELDGEDGSITVENVASVTINSYDGDITVKGGVETLSSDNVVEITFTNADDLVGVTLTGVVDPNYTATTAAPKDYGPVINLEGKNDLESATFAGTFTSIELDSNTNLVTAVISADVTGADGININGNTDLETLTLTGSKSSKVVVDDNDSMTSVTIDTTIQKSSATAATLDGTVTVTGNSDLESLTISSKDVSTLTITVNDSLATIDGTGLTTLGAGGTTASPINPTVSIYSNDFTATLAQDKENATGCDDCDALEENDLGAFTSTSGMNTLKTYLALVAANAKSDASVYFDTVESTTDKDGTETTAETLYATGTTAAKAATVILEMSAAVAAKYQGVGSAVKEQRAWLVDISSKDGVDLTVDGVSVLHDGTSYGLVTMTGNKAIDLAAIKSSLATSRATTLGVTLDATASGNSVAPTVTFYNSVTSASNGENYTNAQVVDASTANGQPGAGTVSSYLTSWDKVTLSIGNLSVTATLTVATSTLNSDTGTDIAKVLETNWNAKYGSSGTSSKLSVWGDISEASGVLTIAAKASTRGSRGFNDLIKVVWAKATAAQISSASAGVATQTFLDWKIGTAADDSDNRATGTDIIVTLLEGTNAIDAATSQATVAITGGTSGTDLVELKSTAFVNGNGGAGTATTTAQNIYPLEARLDVVNGEDADEGTKLSDAVAAVNQTRVHWLGN